MYVRACMNGADTNSPSYRFTLKIIIYNSYYNHFSDLRTIAAQREVKGLRGTMLMLKMPQCAKSKSDIQ